MKIKGVYTKFIADYWLLWMTPIIDTINGFFLMKYGATGVSIGTVYRLILLVYILFGILCKRKTALVILTIMYFPIIGLIRGLNGEGVFGCFTYAMKWILPIALIMYYGEVKNDKNKINRYLTKCFEFWSLFVPISLILEYIFGLGYNTYFNAGFKGLYYSTNDIALVLILIFIYSIYHAVNCFNKKMVIASILCFISIIVLSTKSSLFFGILSFFYIVVTSKKIKIKQAISLAIVIIIVGIFVVYNMGNQINAFFLRYSDMWTVTESSNFISHFMAFATSGRSTRISAFFSEIEHGNVITNLLFGWIYPDNAHVIEMDWHDLMCQYGIIGFTIALVVYLKLFFRCSKKAKPYFYMIILGFIYSILAGHVISGAFSGTVFATAFVLLINYKNAKE